MSCRDYYTCKSCGFRYTDVHYYFCYRADTGVIEKYESLFSTVGYSDGTILRGHVMQNYCNHCDKIVSIYQTGRGASLFKRDATIEFLREFIPKRKDKLLKTSVILDNFIGMLQENESLVELRKFLQVHDEDLYYKINLDEYIGEKAFESMDFNMNDYIEDVLKSTPGIAGDDLKIIPDLTGKGYDLASLYADLSKHVNGLSASDLNRSDLYRDIRRKFDWISDDMREIEREIPLINYLGDEFNVTLDGEEIDDGVCPVCGEEFYEIGPESPCPKCGDRMEINRVLYD